MRLRVVADHVRSALMLIGDGVTPGNEARGYVLRRLLRRVVRSMRLLGVDEPVVPELLAVSKDAMAPSYPELARDFARISTIADAEEEIFRGTLRAGTTILDTAVAGDQGGRRHHALAASAPSSCTTPSASRSTSRSRWPRSRASRSTATASAG